VYIPAIVIQSLAEACTPGSGEPDVPVPNMSKANELKVVFISDSSIFTGTSSCDIAFEKEFNGKSSRWC
jgi:hypothetical protein